MSDFTQAVSGNEEFLWWLAASSLLVFFFSLFLIPWIIVRIPADYFVRRADSRSSLTSVLGDHPLLLNIIRVVRNVLAVVLIVLGVLLLMLPGQGLLTIFLGILIADFPGKRRMVNWLVGHQSIYGPINWLRQRNGKQPINPPPLD